MGDTVDTADFVLTIETSSQTRHPMHRTWTHTEVEIIVEDYFSMLRSEMLGKFYNKVDHCKKLVSRLNLRIEHEIELMYQNISAALIELGLPSISRYKPLYNYQKELVPAVIREFLQQRTVLIGKFPAGNEIAV